MYRSLLPFFYKKKVQALHATILRRITDAIYFLYRVFHDTQTATAMAVVISMVATMVVAVVPAVKVRISVPSVLFSFLFILSLYHFLPTLIPFFFLSFFSLSIVAYILFICHTNVLFLPPLYPSILSIRIPIFTLYYSVPKFHNKWCQCDCVRKRLEGEAKMRILFHALSR